MKTHRTLIIVLSLLVVGLGYIAISGRRKLGEQPEAMWRTNSVERWHTNTLELWRTNIVEVARTNIVVQPVTNEVIKEVPAKLSVVERRAATVGYKYINAPSLESGSDILYKTSPLSVDVYVDDVAAKILGEDANALRQTCEAFLGSRSILVAEKSPYHLSLNVSAAWRTDVPRVALFTSRLELKENVALQRQSDVIQCAGIVWSTATSRLLRTINMEQEVKRCIEEPLDKFCNDYLKAKEREKAVESRIPPIPNDFLSEGK